MVVVVFFLLRADVITWALGVYWRYESLSHTIDHLNLSVDRRRLSWVISYGLCVRSYGLRVMC